MIPTDKLKALSTDALRALNTAIVDELKLRRHVQARTMARALSVGDRVTYNSPKQGKVVTGRIEKVNVTRAHVRTIGGDERTWIVPMSMLQLAD